MSDFAMAFSLSRAPHIKHFGQQWPCKKTLPITFLGPDLKITHRGFHLSAGHAGHGLHRGGQRELGTGGLEASGAAIDIKETTRIGAGMCEVDGRRH